MRTLSVLMPVYNESRTLEEIVGRVLSAPVDLAIELIWVDDSSSDDSPEILEKLSSDDSRVKFHAHPRHMGKGRAIRTAVELATRDIAIIQDADLEYDPTDYPRLVGPILGGVADAVYMSRFADSEVRRVLYLWHSLGHSLGVGFSRPCPICSPISI